jgi:hypothetical protein
MGKLYDVSLLFEIQSDAAAMQRTYIAPAIEACRSRLHAYEGLRSILLILLGALK